MQPLNYPPPLYFDQHGYLLDGGSVYFGEPDADPETSPIQVYWDSDLTIPASQPLQTRGGVVVNNGAPALYYANDGDYSLRVRDSDGNQVAYFPTANAAAGATSQPLSDVLTAIAALATTAYGRGFLTLADSTAAKTYLGLVATLALTGGTMSGNIVRASAGPHLYHMDGAMTSGRVMWTAAGAADPTSQDGDIWLELAS